MSPPQYMTEIKNKGFMNILVNILKNWTSPTGQHTADSLYFYNEFHQAVTENISLVP